MWNQPYALPDEAKEPGEVFRFTVLDNLGLIGDTSA